MYHFPIIVTQLSIILKENGDKLYNNGVTITTPQQTQLDHITPYETGDAQFVAVLLDICFDEETLVSACVTGKGKKNRYTTKLDERLLKFVERKYRARLADIEDRDKRAKLFNMYVNRKIQNVRRKLLRNT
jgi:hypothetical protein